MDLGSRAQKQAPRWPDLHQAGWREGRCSTPRSRNTIPSPEHPFLRCQAALILHPLCIEAPLLGGHKALPSPQWHFKMTSVSAVPSCPGWPLVSEEIGSSSRCLGELIDSPGLSFSSWHLHAALVFVPAAWAVLDGRCYADEHRA